MVVFGIVRKLTLQRAGDPFARMPSAVRAAVLLWTVLFMLSCDHGILKEKRDGSPAYQISYWGEKWNSLDLVERIRECPPELVERIRVENEIDGFKERPVTVKPAPEIISALQSIESGMPHNIREILRQRLIGIFTVRDLGGTGYADVVYGGDGKERYAVIVLDEAVLMRRNANEWATWKENGFFNHKTPGDVEIRMIIEDEGSNTVVNAIRYVLLHEMGHVLGMATQAHMSWKEGMENKRIGMDFPFQKLSWTQSGPESVSSLFEEKFPERKHVAEYSFEKSALSVGQAPSVYKKLMYFTNFPSLNGSQSLWEDFAESFATYFHTVIDQRTWKVIVQRKGGESISLGACWKEPRCKDKEGFMRRWFENASVGPLDPA